jgi:type III restriction enzyme
MLTEGWDCRTVTHVVGLRPFMSQLLCEQVVGRALRRVCYEVGSDGLMVEEVAKVLGVPFDGMPLKENRGARTEVPERLHVHALPERAHLAIRFPRVEGYQQAIRSRIAVDWEAVPTLVLDPLDVPPEVELKAFLPNNRGRTHASTLGRASELSLAALRGVRREQAVVMEIATALTRDYCQRPAAVAAAHVLFPQLARLVERFVRERVRPVPPWRQEDVLLSPYFGWAVERLLECIRPDASAGEAPEIPRYEASRPAGTTADVDFWTSRSAPTVERSHLNRVVADTKRWEQSAAYFLDRHDDVGSFVKNAGLGFAIPYLHDGQAREYYPDFIVRERHRPGRHLVLEVKGHDPLAGVKAAAAHRWAAAVNADGSFGTWAHAVATHPADVVDIVRRWAAGP